MLHSQNSCATTGTQGLITFLERWARMTNNEQGCLSTSPGWHVSAQAGETLGMRSVKAHSPRDCTARTGSRATLIRVTPYVFHAGQGSWYWFEKGSDANLKSQIVASNSRPCIEK